MYKICVQHVTWLKVYGRWFVLQIDIFQPTLLVKTVQCELLLLLHARDIKYEHQYESKFLFILSHNISGLQKLHDIPRKGLCLLFEGGWYCVWSCGSITLPFQNDCFAYAY